MNCVPVKESVSVALNMFIDEFWL